MTYREKRLGLIVGGGLALIAAFQLVNWAAVDPITALRKQRDAAADRRRALEREAQLLPLVTDKWRDRTARTLSAREDDVRRIFRQLITELTQASGLQADLRIGDGTRQQVNNEGFVALPVTVRCSGNKSSVLDFLMAFYAQPYLARISSVNLTAEQSTAPAAGSRGRGRERSAAPTEPKLNVTINAVTLVLPSLPGVADEKHGQFAKIAEVKRLANATEAYGKLRARNIFAKWSPPPPPVAEKTETPVNTGTTTPTRRNERPPPPQPPARDMKIVIAEALNGVPYVAVQDEAARDAPPVEYRVDAQVDGGTVVLIRQTGMVVRMQESGDGSSRTVYYFYEIGRPFREKVAITRESHPELAAALNLVAAD